MVEYLTTVWVPSLQLAIAVPAVVLLGQPPVPVATGSWNCSPVAGSVRTFPASTVPEVGAPAWFDWQGRRRCIARAEGPERIAAEWWRSAADGSGERDYYRLEDADGGRFWLYRETGAARWYLHGLFA